MIGRIALATAVAAMLSWHGPASAGPQDNTIRWASDSEPANVNPYYNSLREGVIFSYHAWDAPTYRDPETGEYRPHLAESVRLADETTLELRMREGVVAHDGQPVGARDVYETVRFAKDPANRVVSLNRISWITGAEMVDERTVRLKMDGAYGPWQEYLTTLIVVPAGHLAEGPEALARQPVGTGPYRITEVAGGRQVVMERFDRYFGGAKGQAEVERLIFRRVPEQNTRVAELLTGGLDWIWRVPPDQARNLRAARRGVTVVSGGTIRFHYLQMDAAGRTGKENNPFTDLRVRQAVNHAIDREGIVRNLVGEGAEVLHTPCHPEQFGCVADAAVRYDYDPERARRLLAEAGYPDGFETPIAAYRERPWAEAVIGNLRAVGIRAHLNWAQYDTYQSRVRAGQVPLAFGSWGSTSLYDAAASASYFFSGSPDDTARDPRVIELLGRADGTTNPDRRREAYAEAIRRITEQAYWAPLWTFPLTYAFHAQLEFAPTADEVPRFYNARWKR